MRKVWCRALGILAVAALASGCGSAPKGLFSVWSPKTNTTFTLDLSNAAFGTTLVINVTGLPLSSAFLAALNTAGRNTSGLTAGMTNNCTYNMLITGDDSSGVVRLDTTTDSDTPTTNACYEYDNYCSGSTNLCNLTTQHAYSISNNILRVTWFGTATSTYGFSEFE